MEKYADIFLKMSCGKRLQVRAAEYHKETGDMIHYIQNLKIRLKLYILVGVALAGMLIKAFWITCPKWFSSVIYISMGWVCVLVFGRLLDTLSTGAFLWLLAGGIIYTVGGVIYALKLPLFNSRHKSFGSHEVFHLFVMAGSICHFIFMYRYVA